ncbi:MAG: gliding motility protein GldL [Prevotella sp.]|nr:gliding motility protein GldL [Prevotella sp.]
MTRYSKFNLVYRLQKWMDSVPGQTFLNYAYSWGAAIVILGTLFKLTHIKGADFWLFLGMGTEVFVFFISAFDRPFDKTADGMELPTHVGLEGDDVMAEIDETEEGEAQVAAVASPTVVQGGGIGGGTIIIGGGGGGSASPSQPGTVEPVEPELTPDEQVAAIAASSGGAINVPFVASQSINPEMTEATNNYVEELKKLTEVLERVAEQSKRLTTDSEEMENLNRTLTGICKIYEMQLKTASAQMGTGDEINAQMKRMAGQIEELNRIYTRMIEAMTVNMPGGTVGQS